MTAFTYRMPAGIPGDANRAQSLTIEAQVIHAAAPPTVFGVPLVMDATSKGMRMLTAGDTAGSIYGWYVRPWPGPNYDYANQGLGQATPPLTGACNVMKRGYMTIQLGGATAAAKNGTVYARIATAGTGKPIGGVEAAADGANTVVVGNCYFMGPADAAGNVEIAYNL